MAPTRAEILAKVSSTPAGLRTREVVALLGGDANSVSSVLSKLYAYGLIDKTVLNKRGDTIWRPLEAKAS